MLYFSEVSLAMQLPLGASIITISIVGVPYYNYSITGPNTLPGPYNT